MIDKDYIKTHGKSKNLSPALILFIYCDFQEDAAKYWFLFELANSDSQNYFKVKVSKLANIFSEEKQIEWNLDFSDKKSIIKS